MQKTGRVTPLSAPILTLLTFVVFLSPRVSHAEVLLVPDDYDSIQEAIDDAEDGDVIEVSAGTYSENVTFEGKAIAVVGVEGPELTIIDASALTIDELTGCGVLFDSDEGPDSVLRGFTITGGTGYDGQGGAIYCKENSPTIEDCILTGNSCFDGGGIYFQESQATVSNCRIIDNEALGVGGGVGGCEAQPTLTGCEVLDNYAGFLGGGVGVHIHQSSILIEGCLIEGNELGTEEDGLGSALWFQHGTVEIRDTIVRDNTGDSSVLYLLENEVAVLENCQFIENSTAGAAIHLQPSGDLDLDRCVIAGNDGEGIRVLTVDSVIEIDHSTIAENGGTGLVEVCIDDDLACASDLTINNTIVWGNDEQIDFEVSGATVSYSCVEGGAEGDTNIDEDPLLVTTLSGSYRLASDSPCVDSGDPDLTDDDESIVDMGAHAHLSFEFLRGDADGNGDVFPILDALYLLAWGFTNGEDPPCWDASDVDDDGTILPILEAIDLLEFGFANGDDPPDPGPDECGQDPTEDDLDCGMDSCD